jgi:hypothetical protein
MVVANETVVVMITPIIEDSVEVALGTSAFTPIAETMNANAAIKGAPTIKNLFFIEIFNFNFYF